MRNIKMHVLGILSSGVLILLITMLMNSVVLPIYTLHNREKELPDVTELTFDEASKVLKKSGLRVIREPDKFDATYPAGIVIQQNPLPFSKVKKGRRIYLTLSAGERLVQVPRVIGTSERDASFKLRTSGLRLGQIGYEFDSYYPHGVVCKQSMMQDASVSEGDTIDIVISLGRMPSEFEVPDVVGISLTEAKKRLAKAGLPAGKITFEVQPNIIPDTVIRQSIEVGTKLDDRKPVNLVVSQLEAAE